jgi:hypothetical protein
MIRQCDFETHNQMHATSSVLVSQVSQNLQLGTVHADLLSSLLAAASKYKISRRPTTAEIACTD